MSALCQKQTFHQSFDQLVGAIFRNQRTESTTTLAPTGVR